MNTVPRDFIPILTKSTPAVYLADVIAKRRDKVVGIWGPSGSGKTTFSRLLSTAIGADSSLVFKVENYWQYTRAEMAVRNLTGYDWETRDKQRFLRDLELLKKGQPVDVPVFDNIREVPTRQTLPVMPKDVIILEDTLDFSGLVDMGIFIVAPDEELIKRRLERDADKTGFASVAELESYLHAKSLPTYRSKLLPSMRRAEYVLDTHKAVIYENPNILRAV